MLFEKVEDDDYTLYMGGAAEAADGDNKSKVPPANCDDEEHCCKCIPLTFGVKLIGIFIIINAGLMLIDGFTMMGLDFVMGLICVLLALGPVFAAWRFL